MRRLPLLAFGTVSIVVVAAVVTFLWSLGSGAAERTPFSTADMVPRDVELYVAVNTEPSSPQWMAFADVLSRLNVEDPARDALNELLADQDTRWDEDIVALLGDEGYFAITDFGALDDGRGVVAAFKLRDAGKAEDTFLRLVRDAVENDGSELLEREYEGETIYYIEDAGGAGELPFEDGSSFDDGSTSFGSGALAFVEGVAVAGLAPEDVEGVIDVIQGRAPTVLENARVEELRAKQQEDFLIWGYADLAAAWDAIDEYVDENSEEGDDAFQADDLEKLRENADRATFTVSMRNDGFVFDASVLRAPGAPNEDGYGFDEVFNSHYAQQVPEDTLAFVAGRDLYNEVYKPISDSLSEVDLNLADPYCGGFGLYVPTGEYSEQNDPVYGQFYDESGQFDYEAYEEWDRNLQRFFTAPDGTPNYEAYYEYLDSLYQQYCEEESQTLEEAIAEFEQDVGFDLEDDLLGLLTGEFAVAVNAGNFDADVPDFDVLGLLDVTDAARVDESMTLLGQYLEREEGWQVSEPDNARVHRISEEAGSDGGAWAVTDETLAISYPDAPASNFVSGFEGDSLAQSEDWQDMMALLPEQKTFVAYVSLARLIDELRNVEDAEQEFADATDGEVTFDDLEPIRSLGIATTNVEGGWGMRIAVLIND